MKKDKYQELNLTHEERTEIESSCYDIVSVEDFLAYRKQKELMAKVRYYVDSTGYQWDLFTPHTVLTRRLFVENTTLSQAEKETIVQRQKVFYNFNNKANKYRARAFKIEQTHTFASKTDALLIEKKAELLEYFGRMFSIKEVYAIIKRDWRDEVSMQALTDFYKDNLEAIERRIENHRTSFTDLRLAVKKSRIEEQAWLYGQSKEKYRLSHNREDAKILLSILDNIRKETEGENFTINAKIELEEKTDITNHLRNELLKSLNLKEIILGRIAAKSGISAMKLIENLNKSFYFKLNTLLNPDGMEVNVGFPSEQPYDFLQIKRINDKIDEQEKQEAIQEAVIVPTESLVKNALLAKIRLANEKLNTQNLIINRNGIK